MHIEIVWYPEVNIYITLPCVQIHKLFEIFFPAKKTQRRRDDGMYTLYLYVQCSLIHNPLLYRAYSQSEVPIRYNAAVPVTLFAEQCWIGSCYVHYSVL